MLKSVQEFISGNFMAHGYCFLWKPELVWLHAGSDFFIGLAYYSIPLLLLYFVRQRHDVPFQGIFLLFSAFILSCGTGHFIEILTLWYPEYWLSGSVKAFTAVVSLYTASAMVPLIPQALALPSPAQLEAANLALAKEIAEHKQTVEALKQSQQRLSLLVQQTPIAVIEWNLNGEAIEWNPAAEKIFGHGRSEAIGHHATELMVTEGAKAQFDRAWQDLLACQDVCITTNKHHTQDCRSIYCEWYNIPLVESNGSLIGVTSLVQDITQRKAAEDALKKAKEELEQRVEERAKELAKAYEDLQAEMSDRQMVESVLWQTETCLHTVVTKAPIILYATDSNGTVTLLEGKGLERLGQQPDIVVRKQECDRYRSKLEILENLPDVLAGEERAWFVEVGDSVYQNQATPLRDTNDRVIGLIGVAIDITQRHQAQLAAKERERYLAAIVEVQRRLLAQGGEENYYLSILELLGRVSNASHVYVCENTCEANGDSSLVYCAQWCAPKLSWGTDAPQCQKCPYDECVPYWSQRLAWGETIMGLVSEFPEPERLILERQGILSLLVLPLMVKDRFFGFIVFDNAMQARVWSASAVDLLKAGAAALSLQHERSKAEVALRRSEAQLREQATELEQTIHQLKQAQAQLVQSEKMSGLGRMVAGIAHEINNPVCFVYGNLPPAGEYIRELLGLVDLYRQHYPTPVSAIQEYAEAIDLDFLAEDLPNLLASMKVGAERIRDIVMTLRTFSRLDEAEMKRVNIHEGIDTTLIILQHRLKETAGRQGIEVIKKYGTLPPIECYSGQLNQVFMNILANAIDALESQRVSPHSEEEQLGESSILESENLPPHRSPRIEIRTELANSSSSTLDSKSAIIRIIDNGPGMTERVQRLLFDPFFTTKPVGQGTGLGLSISYQIVVAKHGGQLCCVSAPGQGTEFIIQIPIVQSQRKLTASNKVTPAIDVGDRTGKIEPVR